MNFDEYQQEAQMRQIAHYTKVAEYAEARSQQEFVAAYHVAQKAELEFKSAEKLHQRVLNACRPSITLQATVEKRGDMYLASAAGISAEGESPEIAFQNFDHLWSQGEDE